MRSALSAKLAIAATAFLVVCTSSSKAHAHKVGLSKVTVAIDGQHVEAAVALAKADVVNAFPDLATNADGELNLSELDATKIASRLSGLVQLKGGAVTHECATQSVNVVQDDGGADEGAPGVVLKRHMRCSASAITTLELPWLSAVDPRHRAIVDVAFADGERAQAVLTADAPTFAFCGEETKAHPSAAAPAFFGLGIEHILIGADHLLFLFALVLLRARRRDLLVLVSAFTVAHSITLSAAALGWMALPGSIVEPIIALSVALVGVENLLTGRFAPDMSKRWRLTFAFGLVHGFGFAGVLSEIGLPQDDTALALVLFNVGVEAGQLMVLAALLPILWFIRRKEPVATWFDTWGVRLLSGAVIVVGLFWLIERVV